MSRTDLGLQDFTLPGTPAKLLVGTFSLLFHRIDTHDSPDDIVGVYSSRAEAVRAAAEIMLADIKSHDSDPPDDACILAREYWPGLLELLRAGAYEAAVDYWVDNIPYNGSAIEIFENKA